MGGGRGDGRGDGTLLGFQNNYELNKNNTCNEIDAKLLSDQQAEGPFMKPAFDSNFATKDSLQAQ